MWELIRANNRKSVILFVGLALCLLGLGYGLGEALAPGYGGLSGLLVAVGIWIVLAIVSLTSANSIFLSLAGAKPITRDVHPRLFNVTEEMRIAANLPVMPKLYVMNERAPNAFATGLYVEESAIVVTSGLLAQLNRDELQGVIAHEMSHILNRDIRFITLAGIMLGSIALISEAFLRGMYYSGGRRSSRFSARSGSRGGGQAQVVLLLIAIAVAVLAPIMARILYFAISRRREYLADATAVRLTRYPQGLASALERLSLSRYDLHAANKVMAPMYIVNPLKAKGKALSNLTSTHPPIDERIRILRGMMGGASYRDYQKAFSAVKSGSAAVIPPSGLDDQESIPVRKAHPEPTKPKDAGRQLREIGDIMRAANGFAFIVCVCGMKFKTPPNFRKKKINCPRCHRDVVTPVAEMATIAAAAGAAAAVSGQEENQTFVRKTKGWESVQCLCGHLMQISPLFAGTNMKCQKCKRAIEVK